MPSIKCSTLRGYLQAVSGLFITPENPGGFTPKELDILAMLIFLMDEERADSVNASVKKRMSEMSNHPIQVITNYIKKLRDKKALTSSNRLHAYLKVSELTFINTYAGTKESKNNV